MSADGYVLWTLALAAALWWPVARLVWVLSVRRLERRSGAPLDSAARAGQRRRAGVLAVPIALVFAALFNLHLLDAPWAA